MYRFFWKFDHGADVQEARLAVIERLGTALSIQRHRSDTIPLVGPSEPPALPPFNRKPHGK